MIVTNKPLAKAPKTVLICTLRLIGDAILTTPLIRIIKDTYPDAAIDILAHSKVGDFFGKDPRVRQVINADYFDVDQNRHHKSGRSYMWPLFRKYDLAINMNNADRGSYSILFASNRYRVGFHHHERKGDFWKRMLFSHPIVMRHRTLHRARLCQLIAEEIGISVDHLECRVFWDQDDERAVAEYLQEHGVSGSYFVVHPFARGVHKCWSLEHFAAVSDAVAERYGFTPVWSSSPVPGETVQLAAVAQLCRFKPVMVPGVFSINQMAYLLTRAALYIGLDTAISHLAATVNTPLVALYGPTLGSLWYPWNNQLPIREQPEEVRGTFRLGDTIVIQKNYDCVPCGQLGCDNAGGMSRCLVDISVDEVLVAVGELLMPVVDADRDN